MSFEAISWACRQQVGKSSVKFVLIALANHADVQGYAWPSISMICHTTEQDRKTVISALKTLCERGMLIDTGDAKGRTKQVPMYRLSLSDEPTKSAENGPVKQHQKRNSSEKGTVPETTVTSAVFTHKQSQKRDTEPSRTIKEPSTKDIRPDDISETLWADFLTIRKAKKAPVTATVIAGLRREAKLAGIEFSLVVATCCERGWASFKADWAKPDAARGGAPPGYANRPPKFDPVAFVNQGKTHESDRTEKIIDAELVD